MTDSTNSGLTDEPISVAIARAVADAKDVEPTELGFSLQDYIDTTAVNRLNARSETSWTLSIELPETTVTVASNGLLSVYGPECENIARRIGESVSS